MRWAVTRILSLLCIIYMPLACVAAVDVCAAEGTDQLPDSSIAADEQAASKTSWWKDHIDLYGDFRLRYEMIKEGGRGYVNRARLRARLGFIARILDELDLGLRIATGSGDPVSTNITLGEGFSKKFITLDMAYIDWHPLAGLHVVGGKMKNPFFRPIESELIWDSDLTPEGASVTYEHAVGPVEFAVNSGGFWVNHTSTNDSWLIGGQGLVRYNALDEGRLYALVGASYYYFTPTIGKQTFYDANDSYGNSVDAAGLYTKNYRELEAMAVVGGKIRSVPMAVFGQYVMNLATSSDRYGWMAGFFVGEKHLPLRPAFRYNYRWLEKDAVVGLFTDSDFNGGDTDGKGHEFNLDFSVTKKIWFEATYFLDSKGLSNGKRYQRVQLDFNIKF